MPPRKRRRAAPQEPPRDATRMDTWRQRVARAVELRKDWMRVYSVEKSEQFFLGKQDATIVYNHLAATIKTSRPNQFFQTPKFFVRPHPKSTEPVGERTAAIGEGVMESIARQDDHLEIAGNMAVFQAYFRIGVLKTCYDPRMEPNPQAGAVIYETTGGEPVAGEAQQPVPVRNPLTGEPLTEPAEVLTDEVYRWSWVDAANMLLPDEGPDRTKWTWIGEEVVVRLEDAKEDPRFSDAVRARLVSNASSRVRKDGSTPTRTYGEAEELLRYNEVYDIRGKVWYVWADGQDDQEFLVDGEPFPSWIDNDPYSLLFLGDPIIGPEPNPWPKPVVFDWLPVQQEYNTRRAQINQGAKRAARKGIYKEGAFDNEDEALKAMVSPTDMEFAKGDPDKIKILEVPPLSMDIWRDLPALLTDWRIITGQTGARQADPEGDTATEATFTERAASLRDADMQKAIIRWMSEAGRKMFQAIKATLTLSMWVQIREMSDAEFQQYVQRVYQLDPLVLMALPGLKEAIKERIGTQKWQQVTREQLQFEADVSIVPGSSRPRNLDTERRGWMELLKVFGGAPQLLLSRELIRYTAEKFDVTDERMLDELHALGQQMMAATANQAGRNQGGASGSANGTTASPEILAQITGGTR